MPLAKGHTTEPNFLYSVAVQFMPKPVFSDSEYLVCADAIIKCAKIRFQIQVDMINPVLVRRYLISNNNLETAVRTVEA